MHAEQNALSKLPSLKPTNNPNIIHLLVIRVSGKYKMQSSKPCSLCLQTMIHMPQKKGYKIHRIYYSNENGEIVNTTLNALLKQELHHSRGSKYIMQ